jgi:hypothetical protein
MSLTKEKKGRIPKKGLFTVYLDPFWFLVTKVMFGLFCAFLGIGLGLILFDVGLPQPWGSVMRVAGAVSLCGTLIAPALAIKDWH